MSLKLAELPVARPREAIAAVVQRLSHWWHGDSTVGAAADTGSSGLPAAPAVPAAAEPQRAWPDERLAVMQRLFGEGFTSPGGAEAGRAIIKALGLNPAMSVVDLSGGLGGMGRLIARETGAWVTSVEADPELVAAGMHLSTMAGLAKKAPVLHGDLGHPGVRPHSQDAIIGKERTYAVADKASLFADLKALLKPGGQLTFTDYMLAAPDAAGARLDDWRAAEPSPPHLLDPEGYRALLAADGFEVRIMADITGEFCAWLVGDFTRFADGLKHQPLTRGERAWVVREARSWLLRVAAIDSGALRIYRVYARLAP